MSGKRSVVTLGWGAALALAVACGQTFQQAEPAGGAAGSALGGSASGGSARGGSSSSLGGATEPLAEGGAGTSSGASSTVGGKGGSSFGTGGEPLAQAGEPSGDSGAAGAPSVVLPPVPLEGLELWFDAARGVTQSGGAVSQWADQSGHGRDALQTAVNLRPKLVNAALSGRPALVFDGSEIEGDFLKIAKLDADFAEGVSIFVAGQELEPASAAACEAFFEASKGSEIADINLGTYQKSLIFEVASDYINDTNYPMLFGAPEIAAAILDPSRQAQVRRNSNLVGQGQMNLPELAERMEVFIGRSLYAECKPLHGTIGEVLVYSRAISDLEILQLEEYLQKRWGCCTQ